MLLYRQELLEISRNFHVFVYLRLQYFLRLTKYAICLRLSDNVCVLSKIRIASHTESLITAHILLTVTAEIQTVNCCFLTTTPLVWWTCNGIVNKGIQRYYCLCQAFQILRLFSQRFQSDQMGVENLRQFRVSIIAVSFIGKDCFRSRQMLWCVLRIWKYYDTNRRRS